MAPWGSKTRLVKTGKLDTRSRSGRSGLAGRANRTWWNGCDASNGLAKFLR